MPELFPLPIPNRTPLLAAVEVGELGDSYISAWRLLSNSPGRTHSFLASDSHLSDRGCAILFRGLIQHLGRLSNSAATIVAAGLTLLNRDDLFELERIVSGDLTRRLFGVPLFESVETVSRWLSSGIGSTAVLISETKVAIGHYGEKRRWRNPGAPIQLKVLTFGNSFFERGDSPSGLSYWGKLLFSDFEFIWAGDLDLDYIEKAQPDLVICQTVERFLRIVPRV
jgi:hypothetical protein